MGEDRDNHIKHPDRLKVVLEQAGVDYDAVPSTQPGELVIVAFLARDDGALDIEELNDAAYQAVLRIGQAGLRFADSDLRGLLVDEWGALRARAEAAEAEVARLKDALRLANDDAERTGTELTHALQEAGFEIGELRQSLAAHEARMKAGATE